MQERIMETNLEKATAFSKEHLQDFIKELQDILRIKSISSDPVYKSEMIKCADWLVAYLKGLGVTDARSMDSGKNPIFFGSLNQAGAGNPTILIYSHYGTTTDLEEWTHDLSIGDRRNLLLGARLRYERPGDDYAERIKSILRSQPAGQPEVPVRR
jgi:acetylornithine deacetylase/succinyl-diaminopimelate desuccinylase-like protein